MAKLKVSLSSSYYYNNSKLLLSQSPTTTTTIAKSTAQALGGETTPIQSNPSAYLVCRSMILWLEASEPLYSFEREWWLMMMLGWSWLNSRGGTHRRAGKPSALSTDGMIHHHPSSSCCLFPQQPPHPPPSSHCLCHTEGHRRRPQQLEASGWASDGMSSYGRNQSSSGLVSSGGVLR